MEQINMLPFIELGLSLAVLATLVTVITLCVCGCKNSNQKSELVGTAGVVKIHFDDDASSPTPTTPASVKRASAQNSQRSLPEIPHPVGRHDSGDTASEIYATVNIDGVNKVVATPSSSRDHPYEHAYAKLQNDTHVNMEGSSEQQPLSVNGELLANEQETPADTGPESVVISASVAISGQLPSSQELPYITPPAPSPLPHPDRNPQHFSGDSTDSTKGYTSISVREPLSNIRATLPSTAQSQAHYASVSDDSDEMYAAIEEASAASGSDTYAQIVPVEARAPERDVPSEPPRPPLEREPRALMPEPNCRRSAPPEVGPSNQVSHSRQENLIGHKLRHASASSCTNSSSALGSPKPEKRQANSPLPPPPTAVQRISSTGDLPFAQDRMRRSLNEKHQRNNSCAGSSDFYGCNYPVDKHRFSSGDLIRPLVAKELNFDIDQPSTSNYNSIDGPASSDFSSTEANTSINSEKRITESPSKNIDDMYAKVMKKAKSKLTENDLKAESRKTPKNVDDPGYETIDRNKPGHGYETITHKNRKSSHNEPGYETVKELHNSSYRNNNVLDSGPNSMISSDPGYEHITKMDNFSDPNYEVLRNEPSTPPYATISSNFNLLPAYSTVNKKQGDFNEWVSNNNDDDGIAEPNYESMPNDPIYTTGSESDPNYESVRPKEPNYESFPQNPNYESLKRKNPNYESVRSRDSKYETIKSTDSIRSKGSNQKDPNYESVKYFDVSKDPPYEKVKDLNGVDRSDSAAGYERINPVKERSVNGENGTVGDYFQV